MPELRANSTLNAAPGKATLRFPQATAFIWKVDARNGRKILDIVVYC
jgi:hypothetical protein